MSIDIDASIKATTENAERELGRSLTSQEREAVQNSVFQAWLTGKAFWLFLLAGGSIWALDKFTGAVGSFYTQYISPYALWMVQSHTDSVLNLVLQCYMWAFLVPLSTAITLVFLPAILSALLVLWLISFLMGCTDSNSVFSIILFGLPILALIPCVIVVPIVVFGKTAGPVAKIVFSCYFGLFEFIKNKILRLKFVPFGWWMFLTHIVIPAALILLVYFFAADESHIRNGRNIYSAEMQRGN